MQVGDQQRLACGPEQRALAHDQQILARERKGNHAPAYAAPRVAASPRSEEHTSELQSLMRNSYAVVCLKKKIDNDTNDRHHVDTTAAYVGLNNTVTDCKADT